MSIDLNDIKVSCDKCHKEKVTVERISQYYSSYEWGSPLEQNIGKLFKTWEANLSEYWEGNEGLLVTPPELEGWTFDSDGISCDWAYCPECSKKDIMLRYEGEKT
tara:strand:+ start:149 stop:463 length:315 start_codon:yes stop_codon:yes gene_type:complete